VRLDQRLVLDGLCTSRERAQALILAGEVEVGGQVVTKAGTLVGAELPVAVRRDPLPYVSRGGLKLKHALDFFAIDVTGCSAIDVGASTGGFTDCLLQAGAARVCAIDVGYGQLAWSLRSDPRVTVRERHNARNLDPATLPFVPDLAVCDVSFISQTLILPRLVAAVGAGARPIITLVKPQFEVERGQVGKGGVVRDRALHEQAISRCTRAAEALGCQVIGVCPSPLRGPAGNEEYLLYVRSPAAAGPGAG
jgi:23S rRNA (cytidine1920-2'-O)/16S rRNA (cytidine1409-2'-O)-methyltransferase